MFTKSFDFLLKKNIWNIPMVTNSEPYNKFFFGRNSAVYQYLEMKNGWYESKIFKD